MVGSAIFRGFNNIIILSYKELDLKNQKKFQILFKRQCFDFIIIAAAKLG